MGFAGSVGSRICKSINRRDCQWQCWEGLALATLLMTRDDWSATLWIFLGNGASETEDSSVRRPGPETVPSDPDAAPRAKEESRQQSTRRNAIGTTRLPKKATQPLLGRRQPSMRCRGTTAADSSSSRSGTLIELTFRDIISLRDRRCLHKLKSSSWKLSEPAWPVRIFEMSPCRFP